jgi:hypothetical protein
VKRHWIDAAVALALAILAWVFYRKILRLSWMLDDPFHLNVLTPVALGDLFTRQFSRQFGKPLFTPLLFLSLKFDQMQFGANARWWYLHQLISFSFLAPMQYAMLRRWCNPFASAAAAVVTMLGLPMMNVVPVLMLRHYVEGAVFALAAVAVYDRRRALNVLSALLYLVAALYKEIFVPLPLILFAIRKRAIVPHTIAAGIYAILRISLLGIRTESYDFVVRPEERWKMIATLPFRAFAQFGIVPAILIAVCIVIVFVRMRESRLIIIACGLAALLPIVPVAAQLQPRWSFALWLVSASAIAFVELRFVIAAVLIAALASFRVEWPRAFRHFMRMSDEARVFAQLGANDVLLHAETPPVTMQELARFTHARGRAIYDELHLCSDPNPHHFFAYEGREVRATALDCSHIRTAPLFAHFVFGDDGAFYWTLGPYRDGRYVFVLGDDIAYEVKSDAGFRFANIDALTIRIRYESPAGWMTYSPDLRLDMKTRRAVNFDRR